MAPSLLNLIRDSVAEPQEFADRLLAARPRTSVVVEAAVLLSILDALILGLLGGGGTTLPMPNGEIQLSPFAHAGVLLASLLLTASALQVGGQLLKGRGRYAEALVLVVWLEVVALAVQVVTVLVALVLPPLAGIVGLLGFGLLLWCLLHFVRALHGFSGLGRAAGALLLGVVALVVATSLLLAALGFGAPADV